MIFLLYSFKHTCIEIAKIVLQTPLVRCSYSCKYNLKITNRQLIVLQMKWILILGAVGAATAAITQEQIYDAEFQHFKVSSVTHSDN